MEADLISHRPVTGCPSMQSDPPKMCRSTLDYRTVFSQSLVVIPTREEPTSGQARNILVKTQNCLPIK